MNNKPSFLFRLFRAFTPPIIFKPIINFFENYKPALFDGEENALLFKKYIQSCNVYGEYGCGLSTEYVLKNTSCSIVSIDSSNEWVNLVKSKADSSKKLDIHYVDVGAVGDWGRPIDYKKRENFKNYADKLWEQNLTPDLVLIDGRFRVACFLTCLLKAPKDTVIIFDDYTNRPEYHLVEEYASIKEKHGRQAIFITQALTQDKKYEIEKIVKHFYYVMD